MHQGWKRFALVALVLGLVLVTGCQSLADKAAETAVEKATGVKVDSKSGEVSIKTEEGQATISSDTEIPADFPESVPVYDKAKISTVMTNDVAGGKSYLVGMKSDEDAGEIHAWYKKALEEKGWKIVSSMEVGDSVGGVNAEKDGLLVNVAIGYGAEKKADISLTVTPKK